MKIFALFVLAALMAYASADGEATPTEYVGDLEDWEGGPVMRVGEYTDCDTVPEAAAGVPIISYPTCKLGADIGNPLCMVKCKTRGHKGGYCNGKKCTCTN